MVLHAKNTCGVLVFFGWCRLGFFNMGHDSEMFSECVKMEKTHENCLDDSLINVKPGDLTYL